MPMRPEIHALSHAIIHWHATTGLERARERDLPPPLFQRYVARVKEYHAGSWENEQLAGAIAHEQIDGVFAPFGEELIPQSFWWEMDTPKDIMSDAPPNLHAAAMRILLLLERVNEEPERSAEPLFELPEGWHQRPVPIKPRVKRVRAECWEDAVLKLREELRPVLGALRQHGVGGIELLVAANETARHSRSRPCADDAARCEFDVYNPACFNFQLATGKKTLVSRLLRGDVHIGQVVVGVSPRWATGQCAEERPHEH